MRERDLAGARIAAAPDERGGPGAMVGRAVGPLPPALEAKTAGRERLHGRRVERLVVGPGGSRPGRRAASIDLPAGRPGHQDRVPARSGHFERALRMRLATNVGEVGVLEGLFERRPGEPLERVLAG